MMKCLMVMRIVMGVISKDEAESESKIRLCLFLSRVWGGVAGIHPFSPARGEKKQTIERSVCVCAARRRVKTCQSKKMITDHLQQTLPVCSPPAASHSGRIVCSASQQDICPVNEGFAPCHFFFSFFLFLLPEPHG